MSEMRECPQCRGKRIPCSLCHGKRIVPGKPKDESEAARVGIAQAIWRDGLGAVYKRLRGKT